MELTTGLIAAITLGLLWSLESIAPGLIGPAANLAQRARHIALGLLNGAVGLAAAFVFLLAEQPAAESGIGLLRIAEPPIWLGICLGLVLLDFWQYTCHVAFHQVPWLWRFHAVHHNADKMDATVAMRFHTLEILAHGLAIIPFAVLMGISIESVALYNLILLPASMFHHSNVRIDPRLDRWLRLIIVTPRMHWLHHSRWQPETNSNYASVLSIWDRLFGTMRSRARAETVDIGLDGYTEEQIDSLKGMMVTPFRETTSEYGQEPPRWLIRADRPAFAVRQVERSSGRLRGERA